MTASDFWVKGKTKTDRTAVRHKENGFRISPALAYTSFEDRVRSVLKPLYDHRLKLKRICGEACYVELSLAVYVVGDEIPSIHLPKDAINMLNGLHAEVDCDLYVWPDDDDDDDELT